MPHWYSTLSIADKLQFWYLVSTIATGVVLLLTLVVLVWYTHETHGLRKAAQRQNETALRPILLLEFRDSFGKTADGWPVLHNIGFGPAFNVAVSPIENGEYRAEFDRVLLLPRNSETKVTAKTLKNGEYHNALSPTVHYLVELLKAGTKSLDDVLRLPIAIRCEDANEKEYTVRQTLECERPALVLKTVYHGTHVDG